MKSAVLAAVVLVLTACAGSNPRARDELARIEAAQNEHSQALDDVERAADGLSQEWDSVRRSYERAKEAFAVAEAAFRTAETDSSQGTAAFAVARRDYDDARSSWELYSELVMIAAMIDASNHDAYRRWRKTPSTERFSCESVSTSAFRRQLEAMGEDLTGMDVDHIVPKALGGADHPSNYQLLPSSLNRSLGASWGKDKCSMAGMRECAAAMAVSKKCGGFDGRL